jgi:hypothetical protein
VTASSEAACPPATQDIAINLDNRKKAIDTAMYGPLNPAEPNEEYWTALGQEWNVDVETAKKQRCGNCAVFIQTPEMLSCIEGGLTDNADEFDSINEAGDLGYCEIFDFKCASARTCRAWVAGGPVTAAGSKPAPKKDQIHGSKKNAKGSASGGKKITFSAKTEAALKNKVSEHNEKAPDGRKATLAMLKAVYRRGAGAFSSSHRPGKTRDQWAMARVNAFLRLLRSGRPANPNYKQDNDLLPSQHPKASNSIIASANFEDELIVEIKHEHEYESPEHAIFALAELSGQGYEMIPALRAAWLRGIRDNESPFARATVLASALHKSKDADLLPKNI